MTIDSRRNTLDPANLEPISMTAARRDSTAAKSQFRTERVHATAASAEHIARVIFEYAARISREEDISALVVLNADLARDLAGAERCSLWLIDESTGELWTRVAHGTPEIRIPPGHGIVGACIAQGETLVINNAQADQRFMRSIDESSRFQTRSVLCEPLWHENRVMGAIQLLNKANGFTQEDVEIVRFMALYAASSIQAESLRQEAESARLLKHELELAAGVQQRLFPDESAVVGGVEYTGLCRPAKFVGGDYYDFLQFADASFGFTLGDISGKGLPAAVLMASIHALSRALLRQAPHELSSATTELNHSLYQSSSADRYSTFFCGTLNAARDQLTYVNAGHIPPFIIRATGQMERPAEGDLPVGLLPDVCYSQHTIRMTPGDQIVCVSDGILEAQTEAGELWGESRLESVLLKNADVGAKQLAQRLLQAADQFAGHAEQFDDMTIIVVRRTPAASP